MQKLIEIFKRKVIIPVKVRLFIPILIIILIVVFATTLWFVVTSLSNLNKQFEDNLRLHVKSMSKMFEREQVLKLDKVGRNLRVASSLFNNSILRYSNSATITEVENQITKERFHANIKQWSLNGEVLYGSTAFIDSLYPLIGGTITIFQKIDSGYVRISTNILRSDGTSAVGTVIPNYSEVVQSVESDGIYFGRAFVVDDWYTTAYKAIEFESDLVGMIYVGEKEKDLTELGRILQGLSIGKSGSSYIFGRDGQYIITPQAKGSLLHSDDLQHMANSSSSQDDLLIFQVQNYKIACVYFEPFDLFLAAQIDPSVEGKSLSNRMIIGAVTSGVLAMLVMVFTLYFFTAERLFKYLKALELSNKKLKNAELALRQSENLAAMGQVSAGIAHELNNPLGVITMYSNMLIEELDPENPMVDDLQLIADQANRCKKIVGGLLNFARKNKLNPQSVSVSNLLERSVKSVIIPKGINVEVVNNMPEQTISIDLDQMVQVLINLVKNSVDAMPNGGSLRLKAENVGDKVNISVTDSGVGIKEADMERLFTPFFTTKDQGKGTGLGLSLVYGIVKMHKGSISVESNSDEEQGPTGSTFTIALPKVI